MAAILPSQLPEGEAEARVSPQKSAGAKSSGEKSKRSTKVQNAEEFINQLGCQGQTSLKILSIFGNTGDGKSYTLNHTFFDGQEIFKTSASQLSCTVGVWASYDAVHHCIVLDTEGLLGMSGNQNQRTRLLLKVLAISDIVIYRTRAERLHTDMFTFLGDASEAYLKHFTKELRAATERCNLNVPLCSLGPALIIFHETQHTDVLGVADEQTTLTGVSTRNANDILKQRFTDVGRIPQAFSSIMYIGTRTYSLPTDFSALRKVIKQHLADSSVRSPRSPHVIFNALMFLNEKFNSDLEQTIPSTFPDEYFTCQSSCLSCGSRCQQSMNHTNQDQSHTCETRCKYQAQYDNRYFTCKACFEKGKHVVIIPKMCSAGDSSWLGMVRYAWAGYVLECSECGIIYRSREYWYGNRDPVETVVRTELKHVWPGDNAAPLEPSNASRRLLDGVKYLSDTVGAYSTPSSRAMTAWIADRVAPDYWVPNAQILACQSCDHVFSADEKKHHCRACGGGFCDNCSANKKPVPERGWGMEPVRVCDSCFSKRASTDEGIGCDMSELASALEDSDSGSQSSRAGSLVEQTLGPMAGRRVIEGVQSAVETLGFAMEYPRDIITDAARPGYWVPDALITNCHHCKQEFKGSDRKHHCRSCGQGFCDECSKQRRTVPSRGWDHPVRVCDKCVTKKGEL
ncbi:zinc finger FYVE domain-containing protein 1 isoform X2 [Nematostella vectensis]|uniref:zinc finger FYVE domain-containing protein 1 isoform X2 n=1 Tax=Nematostella vectensis TaxID=45351 RepID=UPI002076D90D|nr:zinc finger FYVE domain-containing protein 1 isoform X2 [Nematostella vectensis]